MDAPDKALVGARSIAGVFGKVKPENDRDPARIEQLAFVSPQERDAALALADRLLAGEAIDPKPEALLRRSDTAADLAMFGRMLAADPDYNREAAVQVAHAITTHAVPVEDDYYTAVDDLKKPSEDAGAGFVGEQGFGSGVFYLYLCIDRALLVRNLGGDAALGATAIAALAEAAATVSPGGKQNSFASRARAHYVLAERGDAQPRTLAGAFASAVQGADLLGASVARLRQWRDDMDTAYGPCAEARSEMLVGEAGTVLTSSISAGAERCRCWRSRCMRRWRRSAPSRWGSADPAGTGPGARPSSGCWRRPGDRPGRRRGQEALAAGYALAMRTDAPGRMLADYHTAQVPPARRGRSWATRAAELAEPVLETVLTRREARTDALHIVALWPRPAAPYPLDVLAGALRRPVYTLYVGRKSCPLGLPLDPVLLDAADPPAALAARANAARQPEQDLRRVLRADAGVVAIDADAAADLDVARIERRRDQPVSRRRWQFALREEAILRGTGDAG